MHIVIDFTFAMYIYVSNWLCDKVYAKVRYTHVHMHADVHVGMCVLMECGKLNL